MSSDDPDWMDTAATKSDTDQAQRHFDVGINPEAVYERRFPADTEDLAQYGINPEFVGAAARQIPDSHYNNLWRYQYMHQYAMEVERGQAGDLLNASGELVQFRVEIDTVGQPAGVLKEFFVDPVIDRLKTLFNTGPYEGYMEGFDLYFADSNVENKQIAADEAEPLGVPKWMVEVYTEDGDLRGAANGYFNPFRHESHEAPQEEVWHIADNLNEARNAYQIWAPDGGGGARDRAENIRGKEVYLNGRFINTVVKDGRVWLKRDYDSADGTWGDRHSRRWFLDNDPAVHPQSIALGGRLYKVRETADKVFLVTAQRRPDTHDPDEPEEISPGQTGEAELALDETYPTLFVATYDQDHRSGGGGALGRFAPPHWDAITDETTFGGEDAADRMA